MIFNRKELQSNLELLDKCSSASVNGDVSDKLFIHENGLANMSRGRLGTYLNMEFNFQGIFPIDNFLRIVKAMPGDEISLDFKDEELKISGSKNKIGLKLLEIENGFPRFVKSPLAYCEEKEYTELPENFLIGLKTILPCALNDKNASILSNVAILQGQLTASDNYRIGRFVLSHEFPMDFLIDTYNVQPIIEFNPNEYYLGEDRIVFKRDDSYQICAINLNKFPDFLSHVNRDIGTIVELPEEVKECVNVAIQLPGSTDRQMEFSLSKNKLGMSCKTMTGWFKKNIRVAYDGDPVGFSMNLSVLNDMLTNIGSTIDISEEGNGIVHLENFDYCFPISIIEE